MSAVLNPQYQSRLERHAREDLAERLREGKKVANASLKDLIRDEADRNWDAVYKVLSSQWPDTPLYYDQLVSRLIEDWLNKNPMAVEDRMFDLEWSEEPDGSAVV